MYSFQLSVISNDQEGMSNSSMYVSTLPYDKILALGPQGRRRSLFIVILKITNIVSYVLIPFTADDVTPIPTCLFIRSVSL